MAAALGQERGLTRMCTREPGNHGSKVSFHGTKRIRIPYWQVSILFPTCTERSIAPHKDILTGEKKKRYIDWKQHVLVRSSLRYLERIPPSLAELPQAESLCAAIVFINTTRTLTPSLPTC